MQFIWNSLVAFNANGAAHLAYAVSDNLWYLLIAAAAVGAIVLSLREAVHDTVREEQQAL